MIPTSFEQENAILGPPPGLTEKEVQSIYAYVGETTSGVPITATCWKPTQEELEELQKGGRVWLLMATTNMPPTNIQCRSPFEP